MSDACIFPTCSDPAERDEFCFRHAKYFAGPKPKKQPIDIAKVSEKRKKIDRVYRKINKRKIGEGALCEINSPVCIGIAQGQNHKQKRSPNNLIEEDNLQNSCNPCNSYIESHPAFAKENGHWISRFKKPAK